MAVVITTFDEGWYRSTGAHTTGNTNTLTGNLAGEATTASSPSIWRAWTSWSRPPRFGFRSTRNGTTGLDPLESISLWGVSTPVDTLLAGTTNAYADLQSGISYGSLSFSPVAGNTYEITLTADAVAAINNAQGLKFALGVHLDDTAKSNEWVRFGGCRK